jgi:hypothetical protein
MRANNPYHRVLDQITTKVYNKSLDLFESVEDMGILNIELIERGIIYYNNVITEIKSLNYEGDVRINNFIESVVHQDFKNIFKISHYNENNISIFNRDIDNIQHILLTIYTYIDYMRTQLPEVLEFMDKLSLSDKEALDISLEYFKNKKLNG